MSAWFLGCDVYYWLIKAWEIMYMKRYVFFTSNEIKISNQKHLSFFFYMSKCNWLWLGFVAFITFNSCTATDCPS